MISRQNYNIELCNLFANLNYFELLSLVGIKLKKTKVLNA